MCVFFITIIIIIIIITTTTTIIITIITIITIIITTTTTTTTIIITMLQICRRHLQRECTAFLLERAGDIKGAFDILLAILKARVEDVSV